MEQPNWAVRETKERLHIAWENFHKAKRAEKAAAREKAEEERWLKKKREEERAYNREQLLNCEERLCVMKEEEARKKHFREAERERKRERATETEAVEKRGDKKGKFPHKGPKSSGT
jgi:hypothetical protein